MVSNIHGMSHSEFAVQLSKAETKQDDFKKKLCRGYKNLFTEGRLLIFLPNNIIERRRVEQFCMDPFLIADMKAV